MRIGYAQAAIRRGDDVQQEAISATYPKLDCPKWSAPGKLDHSK
jgi:hypothetical protein